MDGREFSSDDKSVQTDERLTSQAVRLVVENGPASPHVVWPRPPITRAQREEQNGHRSAVLWFTGLPAPGKSTLAHAVEVQLYRRGCRSFILDGDDVRHGLSGDLRFSVSDRRENIRRAAEVAKLFMEAGLIVLVALIAPF